MLWNSKNFGPYHQAWLVATVVLAVVSAGLYFYISHGQPRWPGGGSKVGLAYGIAAGVIFLFEFLLWPRKTSVFRTARWLGTTQTWMQAHLWLGLLTLPLVVFHSGFAVGGPFTLVFLILYGLVFVSGILGLVLQNYLPRFLLDLVPQETVASQMDEVARQFAEDASRILSVYVDGAPPSNPPVGGAAGDKAGLKDRHVGAERRVGTILIKELDPGLRIAERDMPRPQPSPEMLKAVREDIRPYLERGRLPSERLGTKRRNDSYFSELRRVAPPDLREAVATLAELCERRRQMTIQERLHSWLHGWMLVHLPLSASLMVMLVGHIILALRFN